jgi:hypothetical protein
VLSGVLCDSTRLSASGEEREGAGVARVHHAKGRWSMLAISVEPSRPARATTLASTTPSGRSAQRVTSSSVVHTGEVLDVKSASSIESKNLASR